MARVVGVDDVDDPRLDDYRDLTDVALRTRIEQPLGVFMAEGSLVIVRALAAGYAMRSAVVSPRWADELVATLDRTGAGDVPVYVASEDLLRRITGFHVHRGAIASMRRRPLPDAREVLAASRRVVVVEDMVSHTNLGAIFRSAGALGMDAVLLTPSCADPLYRRSVRVSMGGVFALPWARLPGWPDAAQLLRDTGFRLLALTPGADAVPIGEVRVAAGERLALLLGSEGPGLTAAALSVADQRVRIPMARDVDSLNVAAAAAVAFYALGL